jgi:branched-chain amino acid transport system substrate-binding protein
MRRPRTGSLRLALVVLGVAVVASACSIQAPDIQLVGNGSAPGGTVALPSAAAAGKGFSFNGQTVGGGTVGGKNFANDTSCVGKSTDTGVTANEIKLGSTFAISGPVSNISGPIFKGVQAYFNKVNAQGGLFGRKIKLVYYDDGWDAQKGKSKIKTLVESDKVFVLTTVPSSNGLDAAKSYLEARQIPVFGTSGLIETQFRSPMQWPIGTSSRSIARIGVHDIVNRLHVKNAAIIWLDLLAGAEARDAFEKEAKKIGLPIVADRRVSLSDNDYGPVWADIKNQARRNGVADGIPDFVSLAIDPTSAIKALQAAQNLGFKPKVGWGGGAPLFLKLMLDNTGGYAAQNHLLASTSYTPPLPAFENLPAVQDYESTVHTYYPDADLLNPYLEGGFAGAALTVEILRRSGSCLTRARTIEVANSISNYSAAGLTQPLTYGPFGQGGSHYGNLYIIGVEATPKSGTTGEWRAITDIGSNGWTKDATPGQ